MKVFCKAPDSGAFYCPQRIAQRCREVLCFSVFFLALSGLLFELHNVKSKEDHLCIDEKNYRKMKGPKDSFGERRKRNQIVAVDVWPIVNQQSINLNFGQSRNRLIQHSDPTEIFPRQLLLPNL
jgi:hypothetical protein